MNIGSTRSNKNSVRDTRTSIYSISGAEINQTVRGAYANMSKFDAKIDLQSPHFDAKECTHSIFGSVDPPQ